MIELLCDILMNEEENIYIVSKCLPTNYLLKKKLQEKPENIHLKNVTKINIIILLGQMIPHVFRWKHHSVVFLPKCIT